MRAPPAPPRTRARVRARARARTQPPLHWACPTVRYVFDHARRQIVRLSCRHPRPRSRLRLKSPPLQIRSRVFGVHHPSHFVAPQSIGRLLPLALVNGFDGHQGNTCRRKETSGWSIPGNTERVKALPMNTRKQQRQLTSPPAGYGITSTSPAVTSASPPLVRYHPNVECTLQKWRVSREN